MQFTRGAFWEAHMARVKCPARSAAPHTPKARQARGFSQSAPATPSTAAPCLVCSLPPCTVTPAHPTVWGGPPSVHFMRLLLHTPLRSPDCAFVGFEGPGSDLSRRRSHGTATNASACAGLTPPPGGPSKRVPWPLVRAAPLQAQLVTVALEQAPLAQMAPRPRRNRAHGGVRRPSRVEAAGLCLRQPS